MENILRVVFKPVEHKGQGLWEVDLTLDSGNSERATITKEQYDFLQYHLRNLIKVA